MSIVLYPSLPLPPPKRLPRGIAKRLTDGEVVNLYLPARPATAVWWLFGFGYFVFFLIIVAIVAGGAALGLAPLLTAFSLWLAHRLVYPTGLYFTGRHVFVRGAMLTRTFSVADVTGLTAQPAPLNKQRSRVTLWLRDGRQASLSAVHCPSEFLLDLRAAVTVNHAVADVIGSRPPSSSAPERS
jgi:hypothetical protein